jgi:aminoglycoside/choline kinase family phosphotransferase
LTWEFHHFLEWGIEDLTGKPLDPEEQVLFDAFVEDVVGTLTRTIQGFVHRDFQSRNLMVKDGAIAVIDFQDALIGPYVYDITALLRDSYVMFDAEETDFYLDRYRELRVEAGLPTESRDEFVRTFHLQAIQRKLKDAGRFVFIDRVKHNPKFLPNIPRSLRYAVDSMALFPRFDRVRRIIETRLGAYLEKA